MDILQANGDKYRIISYFFDFRGGKSAANNAEGMIRAFLYQLADAIPEVHERISAFADSQRLNLDSVPHLQNDLGEALKMIEEKVCAFIDGIDEYDGPAVAIVHICRELIKRTGLKICLASRPEAGIAGILSIQSTIIMQEFNEASTVAYANNNILEFELTNIDIAMWLKQDLIDKLVSGAEGVILWFKLVFDGNVIDLMNQDASDADVANFLEYDAVPGLEPLYQRTLDLIPPRWRSEAALMLWLIQGMQGFSAEHPSFSRSANARGLTFLLEVMIFLSDQLDQRWRLPGSPTSQS